MRNLLVAVLFAFFAAACGSSSNNAYFASCTDWANANPDGLTSQEIAFCKDSTYPMSKQDGACCTESNQCQSQRCCPYGSTSAACAGRGSCECYTP